MFVTTPFAPHKVERTETQNDGTLKACEKHTHETDARKVGDRTESLFVFANGDAELIPSNVFVGAIAQRGRCFALVYNEVAAHHHVLWAQRYVVLVVFFVFVERIVLVDVFHIGRRLVRRVVAFAALIAVGRVALGVVYAFVSLQDGQFGTVVIRAAEVVVVVVGGVGLYRIEYGRAHPAPYRVEERLVSGERTLLVIVQSVKPNVLQCPRSTRCREGVSCGGLGGYLTPLGGNKAL